MRLLINSTSFRLGCLHTLAILRTSMMRLPRNRAFASSSAPSSSSFFQSVMNSLISDSRNTYGVYALCFGIYRKRDEGCRSRECERGTHPIQRICWDVQAYFPFVVRYAVLTGDVLYKAGHQSRFVRVYY